MSWLLLSLWLATGVRAEEPEASAAPADDGPRMGANVRYRYLTLPKAFLNGAYLDTKDWTGAYANLERPGIGAHVFGIEYAIEPRPAGFLIYAEYWKVGMDAGYWDDRDDGAQDMNDGDWMAPTNLGVVALGFNAGHEVEVSDASKDVWVGFRLGMGLGLGILTGRIDQWHPGATFSTEPTNNCQPDLFAVDRAEVCPADEEFNLPPVGPILDLDLAWRFHFAQTGILRLDAGIHDMLFFGVGAGAVF